MELLSLYTPMEFIDNTNNDRFAHDPKNQLGRYRALQFKLPYAKTNADPTTFDYRTSSRPMLSTGATRIRVKASPTPTA